MIQVSFIKEILKEGDIQESDLSLVYFRYADPERPVWGNDIWADTQGAKRVKRWGKSQIYKSGVEMSLTVMGQKEINVFKSNEHLGEW